MEDIDFFIDNLSSLTIRRIEFLTKSIMLNEVISNKMILGIGLLSILDIILSLSHKFDNDNILK